MSIERIESLTEVVRKMEEMKKSALSVCKDRRELRLDALSKIQTYLKEVSKTTAGISFSIDTNIDLYYNKPMVLESHRRGATFNFNENGEIGIYQFCGGALNLYNITNVDVETFISNGNWKSLVIGLIEQWDVIKPALEEEIEKKLICKMNETVEILVSFRESYEKVVKFEV